MMSDIGFIQISILDSAIVGFAFASSILAWVCFEKACTCATGLLRMKELEKIPPLFGTTQKLPQSLAKHEKAVMIAADN